LTFTSKTASFWSTSSSIKTWVWCTWIGFLWF